MNDIRLWIVYYPEDGIVLLYGVCWYCNAMLFIIFALFESSWHKLCTDGDVLHAKLLFSRLKEVENKLLKCEIVSFLIFRRLLIIV